MQKVHDEKKTKKKSRKKRDEKHDWKKRRALVIFPSFSIILFFIFSVGEKVVVVHFRYPNPGAESLACSVIIRFSPCDGLGSTRE